jgi:hypothetical protein
MEIFDGKKILNGNGYSTPSRQREHNYVNYPDISSFNRPSTPSVPETRTSNNLQHLIVLKKEKFGIRVRCLFILISQETVSSREVGSGDDGTRCRLTAMN